MIGTGNVSGGVVIGLDSFPSTALSFAKTSQHFSDVR